MDYAINYFEKGNELLAKKRYQDAIQQYEKDLKKRKVKQSLQSNLQYGHCLQLLGKA